MTVLGEGDDGAALEKQVAALERQAGDESLAADLRRSLSGQIEILGQRIEQRGEAERKLAFIDAELTRIEEQVELIREQAALSTDPEVAVAAHRRDRRDARRDGASGSAISSRCTARWTIC